MVRLKELEPKRLLLVPRLLEERVLGLKRFLRGGRGVVGGWVTGAVRDSWRLRMRLRLGLNLERERVRVSGTWRRTVLLDFGFSLVEDFAPAELE